MKRILIIDDDPIIRNLMDALLRRKGFSAVQAANGEEAVTLLRNSRDHSSQSFDLILLDLMMPRMSGWDFLEFLRKEMPDLTRHVIIVSAASDEHVASASDIGCGEILAKPFDSEKFYESVARCMRGPFDPENLDGGVHRDRRDLQPLESRLPLLTLPRNEGYPGGWTTACYYNHFHSIVERTGSRCCSAWYVSSSRGSGI